MTTIFGKAGIAQALPAFAFNLFADSFQRLVKKNDRPKKVEFGNFE